jgi:hypothetical protein
MLDEAYEGLGVERPDRHFAVLCDFDGASPLPAGDGTASAVT